MLAGFTSQTVTHSDKPETVLPGCFLSFPGDSDQYIRVRMNISTQGQPQLPAQLRVPLVPRTGAAGRRVQDAVHGQDVTGAGAGVCMVQVQVRWPFMVRCCNTFQELRASKDVEEGEELTDCYLDLR